MLTDVAPPAEQAAIAQEMRASVAQLLHDLRQLPYSVRKAKASLPQPQEPVSLDNILDSCARATRHARSAAAQLATDGSDPGTIALALADIHELAEEVRGGVAAQCNLEDLGAMQGEACGRPAQRAFGVLENRVSRIGSEADRLVTLAISAHQCLSTGANPMQEDDKTGGTADAVREVGQIIAATLANTVGGAAPPAPRSTDRRYAAVADQIAASLGAFGLPHAGIQLPSADTDGTVRAQLIDGLRRNFASRQEDGSRVYYRSAAQPETRATDDDQLLRGSALVNAKLLRAEVDGVLAILDRLPDMLRFVPAQPRMLANARARLRATAERLVATASDPLGLNPDRGQFQFQRFTVGVLEVLQSGEILPRDVVKRQLDGLKASEAADPWAALAAGRGDMLDELQTRTGAVRDEEVQHELVGLGNLMVSVSHRVSKPLAGASRGIAAARLEELLTAADTAASALETELERFGTSPAEQEVQFLKGVTTTATAGGAPTGISLAQFITWVHGACEPFVGQENAAAALLPEDLAILGQELCALSRHAGDIAKLSPVSFGGVRRQFSELKRFLDDAKDQTDVLAK